MLQFIFGRAGFGKTFKVQEIIVKHLREFSEKLMLIVPEQYSFDTEKRLLNLLGEQDAAKIQVITFTRLVDLAFREIGGNFGRRINKGDRNLLMSLAIEEVSDKLDVYSGQVDKIEFIEMMTSALSEFKMCNIDNGSLLKILPQMEDQILKRKIEEVELILNAYETLLSNNYIDPLDDLTRLSQSLSKCEFFNGYTVILDEFEGFTAQQLSILEIILMQSKNCYVTLCTDKDALLDDEFNLFSPVNRTVKKILNLAKKNFITIKTPIYLKNPEKFKSKSLKELEKHVFRVKKEKSFGKIEDVFIFNAKTKYDEADFVCRTIKRLIYENDYKYSDFAVITRNDEMYKGILDVSFENYNIPYFMNRKEDIDAKPLVLTILSALEVANSNFLSDNIFRYLKTGLTGVDMNEIYELENYCLFWNLTGKKWLKDFTENPDGYSKIEEKSKAKLIKLNETRKKIIMPLVKLKKSINNTTGDYITGALYEFLKDINIIESLKNFCKDLKNSNQQYLAEEQIRIWNLLIDIFDKMAIILKDKRISPTKYAKLLKLVINSNDIAFIPHGIDEVTFGSIDRIHSQDIKVVFLIGAVDGEFPRVPAVTGIFDDEQRKQLISMGLPLYDSIEGLSINERFLAYRAITMPSEKLYITWHYTTTLGGKKSASSIIREVKLVLPNVKCLDDYSSNLDDEIWAKKPTFELCAKHWNDESRFSQTLKQYFFQLDECKEKLHAIEAAASRLQFRLKDSEKINALFGKNLKISASQIEKFYLCQFAYFCKYGLFAEKRKRAKFDVLQYGNLIHFIFENILKKFKIEELLKFSKMELLSSVKKFLNSYIDENLGGWSDKTERFRYLFNRVSNAAVPLIIHMANELAQSEFLPVSFEAKISDKSNIKPLRLKLPDGTSIIVEGKIDRVDVMHRDKKIYVRVVDYKTGTKEFRLSDILYGLNLQMLIYLEALCLSREKEYGKIIPAGVLYLPLTFDALNLDCDESLEKLEKERMKKLRMNGLILDDRDVIFGMEHDAQGLYIPVSVKDGKAKSQESLASVAQMKAIMSYINNMIISMAQQLRSGVISAQPAKGDYDACEFCEYKSVCLPLKDETSRKIKQFNSDEFFEKLNLAQNGVEK